MKRIVITGACRTPIGVMGGVFASVSAVELGAVVLREACRRSGVSTEAPEFVYMGCVLQAAQGQNVARQAAMLAGIPQEVPAVTTNVVCGSGLQAVNQAAHLIMTGEADIVAAGGMESMSCAPYAIRQGRYGYRMGNGELIDTMTNDALTDAFHRYHMGITAENIAEQWKITRQMQDEFAVNSQAKAARARNEGRFRDEIVPVTVKHKKEMVTVSEDEGIREGTSMEKISRLRTSFKENGTVTAANASGINDGAAAIIMMSEEKAKELGVRPLAYWRGGALAGVDPAIMGIGPVASTKKVLERLKLTIDQIDLIEANEAFAVQSLAVMQELQMNPARVNVNGGAIALGHPVGASGCRILVTLLYELLKREAGLGLATLCIGGGMGCTAVVERYM